MKMNGISRNQPTLEQIYVRKYLQIFFCAQLLLQFLIKKKKNEEEKNISFSNISGLKYILSCPLLFKVLKNKVNNK